MVQSFMQAVPLTARKNKTQKVEDGCEGCNTAKACVSGRESVAFKISCLHFNYVSYAFSKRGSRDTRSVAYFRSKLCCLMCYSRSKKVWNDGHPQQNAILVM